MINMPLSTIVSKFFIISKNRLDTQAFRKWLFYQVYGMPINKKKVVTLSKNKIIWAIIHINSFKVQHSLLLFLDSLWLGISLSSIITTW